MLRIFYIGNKFRKKLYLAKLLSFAAVISIVSWEAVIGEDAIPTADQILQSLLPDTHAEGVFRSWKGISVEPAKKAENEEIPKFVLHVNFDFGKDELTTDGELLLSAAGRALINPKLREYVFFLTGHTDSVGTNADNLDLSERRASRVRRFLMDQFGIEARRLISKGYGEEKLAVPDDPESGLNRRVEIRNIGPEDE